MAEVINWLKVVGREVAIDKEKEAKNGFPLPNIFEWIGLAIARGASDLHLGVGSEPHLRLDGNLVPVGGYRLRAQDTERMARELTPPDLESRLRTKGEVDFSLSLPKAGRLRANIYIQRGSRSLAIRLIPGCIPSLEELGLSPVVKALALEPRGLVLVTGPSGCGKSTTLAAMVQMINRERCCHVITLEDPIEYLHKNESSLIDQREVGTDTESFQDGLRAALREDPDVILVGEMRDPETITIALTAAETGHLVLSSLHTPDAAQAVDRIIDVLPPHQQQQGRVQLAGTLRGVVAQRLLPRRGGGRVPAREIVLATPAVRNLIREGKSYQIPSQMQMGRNAGMTTLEVSLKELVVRGVITEDVYQGEMGQEPSRG